MKSIKERELAEERLKLAIKNFSKAFGIENLQGTLEEDFFDNVTEIFNVEGIDPFEEKGNVTYKVGKLTFTDYKKAAAFAEKAELSIVEIK